MDRAIKLGKPPATHAIAKHSQAVLIATTGAAPLLFLGEDESGQRGDQDEQKDTAEDDGGHDGARCGWG